jgi:hypothetical protein
MTMKKTCNYTKQNNELGGFLVEVLITSIALALDV